MTNLEKYQQGWKDGYDYAYDDQGMSLVDVSVNNKGEYGGSVSFCPTKVYDASVNEKGGMYGSGHAEGMITGRSARVDVLVKEYCKKNGITYIDYGSDI